MVAPRPGEEISLAAETASATIAARPTRAPGTLTYAEVATSAAATYAAVSTRYAVEPVVVRRDHDRPEVAVLGERWVVDGALLRLEVGTAADAAITASISETIRSWIACAEAGAAASAAALMTDAGLRSLLLDYGTDWSAAMAAALTDLVRGAASGETARFLSRLALTQVRLLPDGRAAATLVVEPWDPDTGLFVSLWFLAGADERWLVDDILPGLVDAGGSYRGAASPAP